MVDKQLPTNTEIDVSQLPANMPGVDKSNFMSRFLNRKIIILIMVLLVVGLSTTIWIVNSLKKSSDADIQRIVTQVNNAQREGNYAEAEKKINEALKIKHEHPVLLAALITTKALEGNQTGQEDKAFREAKPYIDLALNSGPNSPDILISVGYAYETVGEYEKALTYYDQAIKINPNSADALFHHGHVLEFLGRRQEAYQDYNKAYEADKNNALVLMAKANMLLSEGKTQESFEMFLKAAEIPGISNQAKSEALASASLVRRSQLAYMDEAVELSRQAVDASPNFSPALAAHGTNLFFVERYDESVSYLKKSIEANPRISRNYLELGQVYRGLKNYQEAINYIKQSITKVENDNTILSEKAKSTRKGIYAYELAKTYSSSGLRVDIMPFITEAVSLNPSLKTTIKQDFEKGRFSELSQDQSFLEVING